MITDKKWQQLLTQMHRLNIQEKDIEEKFIVGSGRGGQKLQKTASCVFIDHHPSGFTVKCQATRSRESNRYLARIRLCKKIKEKLTEERSQRRQAAEKIRRQKRRRSRRAKERMLKDKKHRADIKQTRKRVKRSSLE